MEKVYPEPTVGALIVNKLGKILLVKSPKWFDKFTIPGGHIELGEAIEETLRREVKEEVGLDIKIKNFLIIQEAIFSSEFRYRKHFVFIDFLCECAKDEVTIDKNEITDFVWIDPREALQMNLDSFTKKTIEEYLKNRK